MLPECDFKNELCNKDNRYYKFLTRDLEIKRACYNCRVNMDQDGCVLFQVYGQKFHILELNDLLKEINDKKKEVTCLQNVINELKSQKEEGRKEVANLDKEIRTLDNNATKIRAKDFLAATIGRENYYLYTNNGHFDIKGTNNSTYRITNEGEISKIKIKGFVDRIKTSIINMLSTSCCPKIKTATLVGRIEYTNYPLEDAVAIVYMNIVKDSDRFDRDKACGRISIF